MANLEALDAKLDAIATQVAQLAEHQRRRNELFDELMPILREMLAVGNEQIASLEARGYLAFGRELLGVMDKIVAGYTADDVHALGDSVVAILDTVRSMTQPHVLKVAAGLGDVVERADQTQPMGVLRAVKATREEEVQRGIAVMLEVMRHVGKGAAKLSRRERLQAQLGPRRAQTPRLVASAPTPARAPQANMSPPAPAAASGTAATLLGLTLNPEGFLAEPSQWSREFAVAMAATLGVSELTDQHWKLIEFARSEFLERGVSANIRRLTVGSGIGTKEIYAMFPKAPGKCVAKIAGIPKPVGCI